MSATVDAYRPPLASEWVLGKKPRPNNPPSLLGCGVSSAWHQSAIASLGETTIRPDGKAKGLAIIKAELERGWKAFKRLPDENGIPDTNDYVRIQRAMHDVPKVEQLVTRDWDLVMDHAKADEVISIAVRLSIFGTRNSIDLTDADHQVVIWGPAGAAFWVMGPMRKHSRTYRGHRAPISDLRKAAKAINGGQVLAWTVPIGAWTQGALLEQKLHARIGNLRDDRNEAEAALKPALAAVARLKRRIEELEGGTPGDCTELVANARAAAHESAHVKSIEWHEEQRTGAAP
jgi:hypothetical protein